MADTAGHGGQHGVERAIQVGREDMAHLRRGFPVGAAGSGGNAGIGDHQVQSLGCQQPGGGCRGIGNIGQSLLRNGPFGAHSHGGFRQPGSVAAAEVDGDAGRCESNCQRPAKPAGGAGDRDMLVSHMGSVAASC